MVSVLIIFFKCQYVYAYVGNLYIQITEICNFPFSKKIIKLRHMTKISNQILT